MTIQFPSICPTSREFTCSDYQISEGSWRSVAFFPREWSEIPVGANLRLSYSNIADTLAALFVDCWHQSLSGALPISLAQAVVDGISDTALSERILQPNGLSWRFASAPSIVNVIPGISSVTVELVAEAEPKINEARTSSIFIAIGSYQYLVTENRGGQSRCPCTSRYMWFFNGPAVADFSVPASTKTQLINNTPGIYSELEIYVPPTPARSCLVPYEEPDADQYTTRIYGVTPSGSRTLLYSNPAFFAGWYVNSLGQQHGTVMAGPSKVSIANTTTSQVYGPWTNNGFTPGWTPGAMLGTSGYTQDIQTYVDYV